MAAQVLHKAGLTVRQIPRAIQIARETAEQVLRKELEDGNTQHVISVLKGHIQEKGPKLLFDKLKDLLLLRLMLHLGIRSALATNIAALVLPFVLKRVFELARKNPRMQEWWQEQEWNERMPNLETIKSRIREMGQKFTSNRQKPIHDGDNPSLFL